MTEYRFYGKDLHVAGDTQDVFRMAAVTKSRKENKNGRVINQV